MTILEIVQTYEQWEKDPDALSKLFSDTQELLVGTTFYRISKVRLDRKPRELGAEIAELARMVKAGQITCYCCEGIWKDGQSNG